jgi:hypothetical protein
MHKSNQVLLRHKSQMLVISFVLLLSFICAACGTNVGAGGPGSKPGGSPTAANTTGCPNQTVVTTQPPAAAVVLGNSQSNSTVSVKKGDTVQVDLSFGHLWDETTGDSQSLLTEQQPAGYALMPSHACVWRFVATNTGMAHLAFTGRPICKEREACPQYILVVSFNIEIK